jgi:hypothetical protein
MRGRDVLQGVRRRVASRRIVDRYLIALEREEREREAGLRSDGVGDRDELGSMALEASFIGVAAGFGRRHGISPSTWVEARVSAEVLAAAGVITAVITTAVEAI